MTQQQLKIGFIGGGNMAHAIAGGLLRAGHAPRALLVAEPVAAQRERWAALHRNIQAGEDNAAVAAAAAVLVLAVKPQIMPAVLAGLADVGRPAGQLIISMAAGIPLAAIASGLRTEVPAVRMMPNQPALIGAGVSALVAAPRVSATQKAQALYIAEATGKALWISDESLMDAVTAVSGSGPAYFYLFIELLENAAMELGLPADVAALRASVTSPGGTTAAALAVMDQAGMADILRRALTAARDRGAELGRASR